MVGQTLNNRYFLESEIGHGGMGIVYKAKDTQLGRYVALKVLPTEYGRDQQFVERFRREVLNSARLDHPNVVHVYDVGAENDVQYYVMQLIDGHDLSQEIKSSGGMTVQRCAKVIGQVAKALDHAHSQGIVHRDIKPENILLDSRGDAHVVDFGIARSMEGTRLTGGMIGTPAYMSPEQAKGEDVDGKSDQYSLAVVAYEMLTGSTPFRSDTTQPWALVNMHINAQPPDPRTLRGDLPEHAVHALMRGLAKVAAYRFASCSEFAEALAGAAVASAPAPRPVQPPVQQVETLVQPPAKQGSGGGARIAAISILVVCALSVGGWLIADSLKKEERPLPVATQPITTAADERERKPVEAPEPAAVPETKPEETQWATYESPQGYRVDRPTNWTITENQKDNRYTVVFKAPSGNASILIDAMLGVKTMDPVDAWLNLEERFKKKYADNYQRESLGYSTLGGQQSATWVFTITNGDGSVTKKEDIGGYYNGNGYAVLCSAPADQFDALRSVFDHVVSSYEYTGE